MGPNRQRILGTVGMLCLVGMSSLPSALWAQAEAGKAHEDRPTKARFSAAMDKAYAKKYRENPDFLVLPGLVANRREHRFDVQCETTALAAQQSAEFLIIDEDSSHGYEAMLWSFAAPSSIHRALEFIGMKPGAPRDPAALRFTPKGERVKVSILVDGKPVPIEQLVLDTHTGKTLPQAGWIFTGSRLIEDPTDPTGGGYLADQEDPRAIIACYNEPASVLDPPWVAAKGEFYDSHVASPAFAVKPHTLVTVRFEPLHKDGKRRIRDLRLEIGKDLSFRLKDTADGKQLNPEPRFNAVLEACEKILDAKQQPFIAIHFDDALPLENIRRVASVLLLLETQSGISIEPPDKGRLLYRAFIPNDQWRDPEKRPAQPWEVHLQKDEKTVIAAMAIHDVAGATSQPALTKRTIPVESGADLRARLDEDRKKHEKAGTVPPPDVLLVFAPGDLLYGELLKYLSPALGSHKTVYVFLEPTLERR